MPVLSNPKHERFAQGLASGKTAEAAHADAGYRANRGNAAVLKQNQSILKRVAEIQGRAAARVEVSLASVTEALLRIAKKAEDITEPAGLSVARAAQMDVAKLHGLVVEKKNLSGNIGVYDLTRMSNEQLDALEAIVGPLTDLGGDPSGEGTPSG